MSIVSSGHKTLSSLCETAKAWDYNAAQHERLKPSSAWWFSSKRREFDFAMLHKCHSESWGHLEHFCCTANRTHTLRELLERRLITVVQMPDAAGKALECNAWHEALTLPVSIGSIKTDEDHTGTACIVINCVYSSAVLKAAQESR